MIETIFVSIEQQIETIKHLVLSAKMAKSQGFSSLGAGGTYRRYEI